MHYIMPLLFSIDVFVAYGSNVLVALWNVRGILSTAPLVYWPCRHLALTAAIAATDATSVAKFHSLWKFAFAPVAKPNGSMQRDSEVVRLRLTPGLKPEYVEDRIFSVPFVISERLLSSLLCWNKSIFPPSPHATELLLSMQFHLQIDRANHCGLKKVFSKPDSIEWGWIRINFDGVSNANVHIIQLDPKWLQKGELESCYLISIRSANKFLSRSQIIIATDSQLLCNASRNNCVTAVISNVGEHGHTANSNIDTGNTTRHFERIHASAMLYGLLFS